MSHTYTCPEEGHRVETSHGHRGEGHRLAPIRHYQLGAPHCRRKDATEVTEEEEGTIPLHKPPASSG